MAMELNNRPGQRDEANGPEVDKSEALYSMYLETADIEDKEETERWKDECDVLLVFTGLFSAALAALLTISITDLQSSPQQSSTVYIANVLYLLANTTTTQPITLPAPPNSLSPSPPLYSIWVNALWSLSLVISLTSALLAVFIHQWAHSYLRDTKQQQSPRDRAKSRTFFADGLKKSHISSMVRAVPTLIHISLLLFFVGLPIWLININRKVCWPVVAWLGLCGIGYMGITIMPIRNLDSPYYSPLSSFIRHCKIVMQFIFYQFLEVCVPTFRGGARARDYCKQLKLGMRDERVKAGNMDSQDHNLRVFERAFESLKQDSKLWQFFDAIPDFCASEGRPLETVIYQKRRELSGALVGLMDRTFSSTLVAESVKMQRIEICMRAVIATNDLLLGHWYFLRRVLKEWQGFLRSVTFGRFVQDWQNTRDPTTKLYMQCVVSAIIATVPTPNEPWAQISRHHLSWIQLVKHHLEASETTLQEYLLQRHSLSLANLNRTISHIAQFNPELVSPQVHSFVHDSLNVLESLCQFDIQKASPALRHQFCAQWNQLVGNHGQSANNQQTRAFSGATLDHICSLHDALHGGTGTIILAGSSTFQHTHCTGHGTSPGQSATTPPANNTTSGPALNGTHPTTPNPQHNQLQVTPTTAGLSPSTSAVSLQGALLPHANSSPAPSMSSTAVPASAPPNGGTNAIV